MLSRSPRTSRLDDEIGDIQAPVGSRKWAIAVGLRLKRELSDLELEAKIVAEWLEVADVHQAWKALGYASFDLWLQKAIQLDPHQAAAIRTAKPGQLLSEIPALRNWGGQEGNTNACKDKPERVNEDSNGNSVLHGGNNTPYTLARLQRDAPELAEMVIKGELTPNAAAIAAGFRKRMISVPAGDAYAAARTLAKHYSVGDLVKAFKDQGLE